MNLSDIIEGTKRKRKADAKSFAELDEKLCMICHAYGEDKRNFRIECFYAVEEAIPEALDLANVEGERGYFLRICKSCRGAFLGALQKAANERRAIREEPKDSDGDEISGDYDGAKNIPVRIHGAIVYMDDEEYAEWRARNKTN